MNCVLGHSWEVWSGDDVVCIYCDAEGRVVVTSEPTDAEEEA